MFTVFKTDKTFLMIKSPIDGKLKHIETIVEYSWTYDDCQIDGSFDFGDQAENEKYLKRFRSGELLNLIVQVKVKALGESGIDILGGCHVKADNFEADLHELAIEHDMKNNACADLKKAILSQYETLQKALSA